MLHLQRVYHEAGSIWIKFVVRKQFSIGQNRTSNRGVSCVKGDLNLALWIFLAFPLLHVSQNSDPMYVRRQPSIAIPGESYHAFKWQSNKTSVTRGTLQAAGMSPENVCGWDIVQKAQLQGQICKTGRQSLNQGHYQPTYQQARRGFIQFITLPFIFVDSKVCWLLCTFWSSIWDQLF